MLVPTAVGPESSFLSSVLYKFFLLFCTTWTCLQKILKTSEYQNNIRINLSFVTFFFKYWDCAKNFELNIRCKIRSDIFFLVLMVWIPRQNCIYNTSFFYQTYQIRKKVYLWFTEWRIIDGFSFWFVDGVHFQLWRVVPCTSNWVIMYILIAHIKIIKLINPVCQDVSFSSFQSLSLALL